jgi:putative MATE family efflux protein
LIGATGEVLRLSYSYTSIIIWGVIIMFPTFVLNGILTSQGETRTTMEVQITGLVLNIILDPIFIYTFKLGVAGAAIATLISMFVGLLMLLFLMKKRSHIRVHHETFHFSWNILKDMLKIGIPASILMILISFYFMILNRIVVSFGTDYIAAFGLVFRLESIVTMPVLAFSTGLMTLMGMFYGAKRYDLLRDIYWHTIKIMLMITVIAGIIFFAVPNLFLLIFTSDPILISIGSSLIRLLVFTYPLTAVAMTTSRGMQAMGLGMPGLFINLLRTVVIAFPLAYLLVYYLGYGIEAVAISMIAGGVVATFIWIEYKFHKLNHNSSGSSQ